MNQYQLDFTKLTIGDIALVTSRYANLSDLLVFADKVVIGGIMDKSPLEIEGILAIVSEQFQVWKPAMITQQQTTSDADLGNMLDGVEGL